ncbi:TRAP transporter small permease [Verminephrobacter aporrectodeae subsp. tuberculatae]|uniref:TRAP transporter small permease protein n=1 Tax=Verminephrobacter aporrectodeae subsp. tuberculatae TaxID=1110392 RepID=A0ABT3KZ31_9BURK|nr:TRAP transporter small permease [Verminephrobacter aporrectodeae]MCW5257604.1 TRAP transporter small permease [Verminephrobacter aporrectodeae subsp. tuberculatae]MCW5323594.1 TRAP transporter small permease [Verminephrobacter aporrectodeae subsp. tuberculatae]
MLTRMACALSAFSKAFGALACAVLAVLVTAVVFQRFVMHDTPRWAEELPRLVLVWSAFIGGVTCSRERSHLMAGLLPFIVKSPRMLAVVDRINHALIVAGLAALGWAGWQLAQMTMEQMLPAIEVSAGVVYLALPVACALTAVVHVAQFFEPWPPAYADSFPLE